MSSQTVFVKAGTTSVTVDLSLVQNAAAANPGDAKTALAYTDITAYYRSGATGTLTAITPATQSVGGAYSSGGFIKLSDANAPGGYRFDIPDAAIPSTPGESNIWLSATGTATHHLKIIASAQVDVVSTAGVAEVARKVYTASGGTSNSVTFAAATVPVADCPPQGTLRIVSGTGAFQWMPISSVTLDVTNTYVLEALAPTGWQFRTNVGAGAGVQIEPGPGVAYRIVGQSLTGALDATVIGFLSYALRRTSNSPDDSGPFTTD